MADRKDTASRLFSRLPRRRSTAKQRPLRVEPLEDRTLLAVTGTAPAIMGTVFVDANQDGLPSAGEAVEGAVLNLFVDDGNGILDSNDVQLLPDAVSDVDGVYCFDNLNGTLAFFVVQPAQTTPGGTTLSRLESGLIRPGAPSLPIDLFETSQSVRAIPPAPSSDGSTLQFSDESEVIGAERDMFVEMTSGLGEVELRVNPFNVLPVLQYDSTSGVEGRSILTWDGVDNDPNPLPSLGLNGRDLTENGQHTGLTMQLGIDPSGAGDTVTFTLFQGDVSNTSVASAPVPVTDGTASGYLFIPFSDFSGGVSPDNVDAIQMTLGAGVPSSDAQVSFVGATGPRTQNFNNSTATTDLSVTKTDGATTAVPGEAITYTITVQNIGPDDIVGATVEDLFPTELTGITYTSTTTGTVAGNTASGSGDISDTVDMTAGSQIVYTVSATIDPSARGTLANTATVAVPPGVTDPTPTNDVAVDTNTLTPEVDLQIVKDDGVTQVAPGGQTTYTITVTNAGPSDVVDATIEDLFPTELTNVTYTSAVDAGTVSGNTPSGSGNISDTVSMTAGSVLRYTVTATVNATSGSISNTATVTPPGDTTERDSSNNSSTDTNDLSLEADLSITKDNGQTTAAPGQTLTYTIVVSNSGPSAVTGATVTDAFPSELSGVSYTSSAQGGASGNTASGSGNISDTVNLPVGASITYTASGTVINGATSDVVNTANVAAPANVSDTDPSNNSDTDTDTLIPGVDLQITKVSDPSTVSPGGQLEYTIVVTNNGPNPVTGADVEDVFPSPLTNVSYTSTTSGSASGNTASGTGNINDTLNLGVNGTVTYTVQATVAAGATGSISNTATVTAPTSVTELDSTNNSDTDVATIDSLLASISGFVYLDLNNDGTRDPGEPAIPDVEIILQDEDRNEISRVTTDDQGVWSFDSLAAGDYFVQEVQPEDFRDGMDAVGGNLGEVVESDLFFVMLGAGDDATDLRFGELPLQPSKRSLLASAFRSAPQ